MNLHILFLGTGQGLCERKQHMRKGRGDMREETCEGMDGCDR